MKNKIMILLVAAMMVVGLSSNVFAAAQAMDAFTDVPTIPRAACDKAGTYGLKAGNTWKMHENDIITFTLTNNVTLCKAVDYFMVVLDGNSNTAGGVKYGLTNNSTYPVYSNDATNNADWISVTGTASSTLWLTSTPTASNLVFGYLITGSNGGNQITMQLKRMDVSNGTFPHVAASAQDWIMTYYDDNPAAPTQMNITLFDYKENMYVQRSGLPGFLKKNTAVATLPYTVDIDKEDNVLCVNTANYTGDYVELSPVSSPDAGDVQYRMSFTGTYRVAQITGSAGYTIAEVGKVTCPDISTYAAPDQTGASQKPTTFDPGTYDTSAAGSAACSNGRWRKASPVCGEAYYGHGLLITNSVNFNTGDQYKILVTLAVKSPTATTYTTSQSNYWFPAASSGTVYWTTGTNSSNTACTANPLTSTASAITEQAVSSFTTTRSGSTFTGYKTLTHGSYVTVAAAQNTLNAFMVDIPLVQFNADNVTLGETVGLYVEVIKYPCLVVKTGNICLGKIVATECPSVGVACTMNFPYGIDPSNASWWSGVALTNQGSSAGTATLTLTDTDGGTVTYTKALAANKIEIIAFNSAWYTALTSGHTLASNKPWRLKVTTTFTCDGLLMIGDNAGAYGIHGYQPRNSCYVTAP